MASRDQINFDYSAKEWTDISCAVAKVRREPLSDIERDALRVTADDYLRDQREKRAGTSAVVKRRALARAWEKVGSKVAELKRAVEEIGVEGHPLGLFLVTDEMLCALQGLPAPAPNIVSAMGREITVPFTVTSKPRWMTAIEICAFLSQLKITADRTAAQFRWGPAYCWTYTGRLEPRVPYMQQILWLWTHRFAGELTLSIDSTHIPARVYGALVDYVAAVAGPAMKDASPKPSALRNVIDRQKKFYAWLSDYERKFGEIGPWAYNRAEAIRARAEERDAYGEVAPRV
jgi:hypothetical protein